LPATAPRLFVLEPPPGLSTCSEILGLGELGLDYALRGKEAYAAYAEWPRGCTVYGIYEALGSETGERVARRITGGPRAEAGPGRYYLALALPGTRSLRDAVSAMMVLAQCMRSRGHGATVLGDTAFIEIIDGRSEPGECLDELLRGARRARVRPLRSDIEARARLFEQDSWRLYRYRATSVEALVERGSYWLRASLEITDGYVTGYWLSGVFYSAPPTEIYSVFNTLRGVRLDEIVLGNMEVALEKRLEVAGLETSDLQLLVKKLYEKALARPRASPA